MLTWDIDQALSIEAPAIAELADRVSECAGFQRLNDDSNAALARTHVVIGPQDDPWQGLIDGKATVEMLLEILLRANVHPSDENPHDATEPGSIQSCPDEGGTLEITIRRQVRQAELSAIGEQGVFLAFTDCISSIVHDLQQMSNDGLPPRLRQVRMSGRAGFGSLDTESAQGVWMGATIEGDWGDRGASE